MCDSLDAGGVWPSGGNRGEPLVRSAGDTVRPALVVAVVVVAAAAEALSGPLPNPALESLAGPAEAGGVVANAPLASADGPCSCCANDWKRPRSGGLHPALPEVVRPWPPPAPAFVGIAMLPALTPVRLAFGQERPTNKTVCKVQRLPRL